VHVLKVGLGDTVELVLIDEGYTYSANHPMHLHGNYFRVIGMDKVSTYKNIEQINSNFGNILTI
jgi:FtsP/CotA-like multicopper oxidase with cupredoxin domain